MEDRFYLLNIKHPYKWATDKSAAEYWLDACEKAPIFYGDITIESIRQGDYAKNRRGEQPANFVDLLNAAKEEAFRPVMITIDSGKVWIYTPKDGPHHCDGAHRPDNGDVPKFFHVEHLARVRVAETPLVLSSMRANRWLSSGTFVPLVGDQYAGNIEAARFVAKMRGRPIRRLDCLSSVELETLVAKLFEENGYFVPAYRGGFVDGFDLVVRPKGSASLGLADESTPLAIQVKLRVTDEKGVLAWLMGDRHRFLVSPQKEAFRHLAQIGKQVLDRRWLVGALQKSPRTREWLEESTRWVPHPLED